MLRALADQDRPALMAEQRVLAGWSSWGAIPDIFDQTKTFLDHERAELRALLSEAEWDAAARTTINAHYTDPMIVTAMWDAVQRLGFAGGRVLEPGCGSGTFIGLAPPGTELSGVELDPITAAIAARLYPQAEIRAESFAETSVSQAFDLVIGNVPFGNVKLHDPVHNGAGHSIHNHFIVKSLNLVKPGGLVAVLTSRYTMDAQNPAARAEMWTLADLVAAVRLPTGAHERTAGTQAITDLLILRRLDVESGSDTDGGVPAVRDPDQEPPAWVTTGKGPGLQNQYFADHPEMVLGEHRLGRGMYREDEVQIITTGPLEPALRAALDRVVEHAQTSGLTASSVPAGTLLGQPVAIHGDAARFVGRISAGPADGDVFTRFTRLSTAGVAEPLSVPDTQAAELRALLELRDLTIGLLEAENANRIDTPEIGQLRASLNRAYDAYSGRYGPINRYTLRRIAPDKVTGAERHAQYAPPVMRIFDKDPHAAMVRALEVFDGQTQTAVKATIMSQRVVAQRTPRLGADNPRDALAICLDTIGRVDLDRIARLLGTSPEQARAELGDLVYDDPALAHAGSGGDGDSDHGGRLVPAAEYLSGNVRQKLALAETADAAAPDGRYKPNVVALREIQPPDLGPGEIDARLGASWIDADDVQDFLSEILDDDAVKVTHGAGSDWKVEGDQGSVLATSTWGTVRRPAPRLAEALLKQSVITVYDVVYDGDREFQVPNPDQTAAAREKADELNERFSEWIWEDLVRADRLCREYNRRFNAIVVRSYDDHPAMALPGLARTFTPRPHQLAAVARMIAEPSVGLFHEVGAGKTAEMVIGVMEMRRLGLVRKPCIVVPNHMLAQFSREFLQLYPRANVLAAGTDDVSGGAETGAQKRREFVARATTGDWDAIIMTRGAFERIPVSKDETEAYLRSEISAQREALERLRASREGSTVKRAEKALLTLEERIKKKLDGVKDPGVTWEQTGIDYLCVDELHDYKNLATASNIPEASIAGSMRASDLHMKVQYLRRIHGGRAITGATATPIANSITEAYVMQRYLRPDLLELAGITDFDTWAGTFATTVTEMEMSPAGDGWRQKTRFAKFRNLPEFLRMWHVAGDVKTSEDLQLPRPDLVERPDGRRVPEVVILEPSAAVAAYVTSLGERAEAVRNKLVQPDEDNMLKITTHGRLAALDMRLVENADPPPPYWTTTRVQRDTTTIDVDAEPVPTKLEAAADRIARIWADNADSNYLAETGEPHPRPGALQLVFCDLGVPNPKAVWNVYDELRDQLITRGVPAEQIAYRQHAKTDQQKAQLFQACRSGQIQVLLGSTETMGVGTNVQDRAVVLHHLNCPWRPADLTQREGRILRQGNQNPEVQILRYATEGTFDVYSWQTVERKARFINQVMRGKLDVREVDDIGDEALSYGEVKALASGNPLLLEKAEVDAEVAKLERLKRAHARQADMLTARINSLILTIDALGAEIPQLEAAIGDRISTRGDQFSMAVNGPTGWARYTDRSAAATAFAVRLQESIDRQAARYRSLELGEVARIGGHTITARTAPTTDGLRIICRIARVPKAEITYQAEDLDNPSHTLVVRLENLVGTLDQRLHQTQIELESAQTELARAEQQRTRPFSRQADLEQARRRRDEIDAELAEASKPPEPAPDPAADPEESAASAERPQVNVSVDVDGLDPQTAERVTQIARQRAALEPPTRNPSAAGHQHETTRSPAPVIGRGAAPSSDAETAADI